MVHAMAKMDEVTQILAAVFNLLKDGRISIATSKELGNCADDFTRLGRLQLNFEKKTGRKSSIGKMPNLGHLQDHVRRGEYPAAVIEAKRIRTEMAPILKHAREQLKSHSGESK